MKFGRLKNIRDNNKLSNNQFYRFDDNEHNSLSLDFWTVPNDADAWSKLASRFFRKNQYTKAEDCYRRAIDLRSSGFLKNHHIIQNSSFVKEEFSIDEYFVVERKAVDIIDDYLVKEDLATDYYQLGIVCERNNAAQKAVEYWKTAQTLFKAVGLHRVAMEIQILIDNSKKQQ